jgi:hypothetical protein
VDRGTSSEEDRHAQCGPEQTSNTVAARKRRGTRRGTPEEPLGRLAAPEPQLPFEFPGREAGRVEVKDQCRLQNL